MDFKFTVLFIASLASVGARGDIVGGEEVKPADPVRASTAAMYTPSADGRGGALCTASLISNDVAVTAAHCITAGGPKPVLIFGNDVRSPAAQKRQVSAVRVNSKWGTHAGRGMDQGDIALVKFRGGIPEGYRTVETEGSDSSLKKGKSVTLAGYGIDDARAKTGAGTLRKTRVTVSDSRPGRSEMILDQSHGHGACHGDSGGPAFVREGGKMVLAGVTNRSYPASAPDDCAHKVVYTKVSAYDSWIKRNQRKMEASSSTPGEEGYSTRIAHRPKRVKGSRRKPRLAHRDPSRKPARRHHARRAATKRRA